jgi:hypothetical protein
MDGTPPRVLFTESNVPGAMAYPCPVAAPPICAAAYSCPATYGAQLITVTCADNVDFFTVDTYTGNVTADAATATETYATSTTTYPYDELVACAAGVNAASWRQYCTGFPTYESSSTWCGKKSVSPCSTGYTYCGDEGCKKGRCG